MKTKTTKKKLSLFDKIILVLNIISTILLLLSYLAPTTDPRDSTTIALLGFGFLYLAVANSLFIFYWPFRKPTLILISTLTILLGFNIGLDFIGFHKSKPIISKSHGNDLRILQYNVRKFEGIDRFLDIPIQNEVTKLIIENQPDIVTMVEFRKKMAIDSVKFTLARFANLKYNYFKKFYIEKRDSIGNVIFSKYPILNAGSVDTSSTLNTKAIFADILYKQKKVRIYSLHLTAVTMNGKQKQRVLNGQIGFKKLFFLIDRLTAAFIGRSYQVERIKRHIESCPYPYILTGDFNDTPNSFAVNELGDGLQNAFLEKGSGFQTTYYSEFPLQIDYIMATKDFNILNYRVVDKKVSDHKAVISDLRLK